MVFSPLYKKLMLYFVIFIREEILFLYIVIVYGAEKKKKEKTVQAKRRVSEATGIQKQRTN